MRTIRRVSLTLNRAKWDALCDLARRYRAEKNTHLPYYHADAHVAAEASARVRRDALVAARYVSPYGLQARMWKLAQQDAFETVEKQWAALAESLKPLIARRERWSDSAKHYAYWLCCAPRRLAQLVSGRAPVPSRFSVAAAERHRVRNYLRRVVRHKRGKRPRAQAACSIAFDADMYATFNHHRRQHIALMSLRPKTRIVVPLSGNTPIRGTLRVVLDFEQRRVAVHYTAEVKAAAPLSGEPCGLDAGISEVFTDELGHRYGAHLGQVLADASEALCDKGRKRNRLHQLARRADAAGHHAKAKRLRRFNLGRQKLQRRTRRQRAEIERQINSALNELVLRRQPSLAATEQLNLRGRAQSKKLSRRVSLWARGLLHKRVEFKASAEGFRREQVNSAYSSQTCCRCGFVDPNNRRGDAFQCLHCGHADRADRVAAINLKARLFDPHIHLGTPKARVKEILRERYNARLESGGNPATVSGRTPAGQCLSG